jgi:hypothetical protein
MHIWSSVGAVAVYSRARVALIVVAMGVVLVGAGVLVGAALGNDSGGGSPDVPASRPPAPGASASTNASASTDTPAADPAAAKAAVNTAKKHAYARGYRAGLHKRRPARVTGLPADLAAGGVYVIRVKKAGTGRRIAQHVRVRTGATYYLCSGGTRLCIRTGG